jgi:hypothetical protein
MGLLNTTGGSKSDSLSQSHTHLQTLIKCLCFHEDDYEGGLCVSWILSWRVENVFIVKTFFWSSFSALLFYNSSFLYITTTWKRGVGFPKCKSFILLWLGRKTPHERELLASLCHCWPPRGVAFSYLVIIKSMTHTPRGIKCAMKVCQETEALIKVTTWRHLVEICQLL